MKKLLLLFFLMPSLQAAAMESRFTMTTSSSIDTSRGDATLNFDLAFSGSKPIVLARSSIPGVQKDAIWIGVDFFPVSGENFHPCPEPVEKIFINDGLLGTATIQPGQSMREVVKLSDRYSNIGDILGKCDLVVFWSYKPKLETGDYSERLAGAFVLPATASNP